jgi:hypothetical protein
VGLGEAGRRGEVLFEVNEYGTEITLEQLWEGIER